MKLLVTGATGFIGRHLANHLESRSHSVEVVSRRPNVGVSWEQDELSKAVAHHDAVIHLAGAGVLDERWSQDYKDLILSSRRDTTRQLAELCAESGTPIVSTSAVGYYGTGTVDQVFDEGSANGNDFLAEVCRTWEESLAPALAADIPVSIVRVGVVLGHDGGAYKSMRLPFLLGAGGPIGNGKQPFPWVHVQDVVRLYTHLVEHREHTGIFNAVSPEASSQREFAKAMGKALKRPAFLPTPPFAMKLLLGERAEVLTTGQQVEPKRTLESGFEFEFAAIDAAMQELTRSRR